MSPALPADAALTAAELEVVALAMEGLPSDDIARLRGCAPRTTANLLSRAYRKLRVSSRFELASHVTARRPRPPTADDGPLSLREKQVMALVARGESNLAIAIDLRLTEGTVASYVRRCAAKLGVRGRMALIQRWNALHRSAGKGYAFTSRGDLFLTYVDTAPTLEIWQDNMAALSAVAHSVPAGALWLCLTDEGSPAAEGELRETMRASLAELHPVMRHQVILLSGSSLRLTTARIFVGAVMALKGQSGRVTITGDMETSLRALRRHATPLTPGDDEIRALMRELASRAHR